MAEPSNNTSRCPRCVELEHRIAELEARIAQLEGLLEQANRKARRQAAPFSKGEPRKDPKPPGRKSGPDYGTPAFRAAPPPGKIDEVHEAVMRIAEKAPEPGPALLSTHHERAPIQ